jgi:hypothetical protein
VHSPGRSRYQGCLNSRGTHAETGCTLSLPFGAICLPTLTTVHRPGLCKGLNLLVLCPPSQQPHVLATPLGFQDTRRASPCPWQVFPPFLRAPNIHERHRTGYASLSTLELCCDQGHLHTWSSHSSRHSSSFWQSAEDVAQWKRPWVLSLAPEKTAKGT